MSAVPAPATGPDAGAVWHYGDPLGEQRAAAESVVVVDRSLRAVLTVTGPERRTWLHTVSTQHVSELPEGVVTENSSLDAQGRLEDHWLQTDLDGTTYIDTEHSRAEPLLGFLRRMVFRADVVVEQADMAVLSILGPGLSAPAFLEALNLKTPPAAWTAVPLTSGGFARSLGEAEVDLVVPRDAAAGWRDRLVAAGARPAGVWAYEAHRVAALRPRLGVDTDEKTLPHEVGLIGGPGEGSVHLKKGCYRGQETVSRVHNMGKPPRMLVLLHLDGSSDRPEPGDPVLAGERTVGRLGTVVDHVDLGPIALALLKRGVPAETELVTGGEAAVAAVIDPDSLPPADEVGAGRLAVERFKADRR
jgi:tRNA-modifying protein YgfZ